MNRQTPYGSAPESGPISPFRANDTEGTTPNFTCQDADCRWWESEISSLPSSIELRRQKVIQLARRRFLDAPEWVLFHREILGRDGLIFAVFPDAAVLSEFERSEEFAEIQAMVAKLRERRPDKSEEHEPTRVITVRLPASLHEALLGEADRRKTSMNKLCISKLLQMIEDSYIPTEPPPKRRRRPKGAKATTATNDQSGE